MKMNVYNCFNKKSQPYGSLNVTRKTAVPLAANSDPLSQPWVVRKAYGY